MFRVNYVAFEGIYCQLSPVDFNTGDAPGTRTPNLVIKSHLLCQLS